jgi:hypothetical protein
MMSHLQLISSDPGLAPQRHQGYRLRSASLRRVTRILGFGFMCGTVMAFGSGCVRPERGIADPYGFETAPYVMPSSTMFLLP